MSSKTKKNASGTSMDCHEGKGTCQVLMPMSSAMGWNRKIYRARKSTIVSKPMSSGRRAAAAGFDTHGGRLDGKVGEQDEAGAFPLLGQGRHLVGLQLPAAEERQRVDDHPRDAAAEVHDLQHEQDRTSVVIDSEEVGTTDLVEEEGREPGRDDGVPDPEVPRHPVLLEPVEAGKVGARAGIKLRGGELVRGDGRGRVETHFGALASALERTGRGVKLQR
ncbi:hypothetical protein EVG20_g8105 [Dentipellis fragilis]|uniref:Uncharacterized protein n=1 Tax=Dentipellis fragilis TaxID=205917 RepID=A0A4Y9Y9J5_9AGAM|nr:hypothetical protein EVG20_g8105 [Dentipellis fragilis]